MLADTVKTLPRQEVAQKEGCSHMKYAEMSDTNQRRMDRLEREAPDPFLARLVQGYDANPDSVQPPSGITLVVGGTLFTGSLVSKKRWAEAHGGDGGSEALARMVSTGVEADELEPEMSEADIDAMTDEDKVDYAVRWSPRFIHLDDAQPVGTTPRVAPTQMRFRLSEVQGFFLGKLNFDS